MVVKLLTGLHSAIQFYLEFTNKVAQIREEFGLQLKNIQPALIPCEKFKETSELFEPQENIGVLVRFTNQIWVQDSAKTIKLQINYT